MAKIVLDARKFDTGSGTGAGRYMSSLVNNLQLIDSANEYVVLLHERDAKNWKPNAENFSVVVTKYKEFTFGEQFGFAWQLYKLKADLVHFGMVQQPVLYFKRSVCTMHDLTTVRYRNINMNKLVYMVKMPLYSLVILYAARKNKLIITPTRYVKKDIAQFAKIAKDKITVTHEAADAFTEPAKQLPRLVGKEFIMYVGRPQPHKNLGRLIKAFSALKKKHPNLQLVIAGKKDPVHDTHLATAKNLGIDKDVVFTGFVTDGELKWLYHNCMAYVFPSLSEGFGLPALEAMVHGAPVVSSNATCLPEVYGNAAVYFDPTSVMDMTKKIDAVISSPTLRKEMVTKGYRQAKTYSWQRMAEQTLEVYEEALGA